MQTIAVGFVVACAALTTSSALDREHETSADLDARVQASQEAASAPASQPNAAGGHPSQPDPGLGARAPRYVAADRDAGQLVFLDSDLLEVARRSMPYALEVEPRSDGRLWSVSASALGPLGPHVLRRVDLNGVVDVELAIGPLFDLACADGEVALLVVGRSDGQREALEVTSSGAVRQLEVGLSLAAVAANGSRALVAGHDGWLRSHSLAPGAPAPLARHFGGVIADVAAGPLRNGFYVLDVAGSVAQRRLALVAEDLSTVWVRSIGCGALHLCVSGDRRRVWLADGGARFARRFGADGGLEVPFVALPLAGVERGAAHDDGGVVFAAPGALVRLAPDASPLPGQGGFDFLVDVAALRAR